jgi:hypothetical protein
LIEIVIAENKKLPIVLRTGEKNKIRPEIVSALA